MIREFRRSSFWVVLALAVMVLGGATWAQQTAATPDNGVNSPQAQGNATPPLLEKLTTPSDPFVINAGAPIYIQSLDGGGLIQVGIDQQPAATDGPSAQGENPPLPNLRLRGGMMQRYIVYGASISGGYNFSNSSTGGDTLGLSNPANPVLTSYVGLLGNLRSGGYLIQYAPTVTAVSFPGNSFETQAFHSLSAIVNGAWSRTWGWNANVNAGYGSQLSRFLGPLSAGPHGSFLDGSAVLTDISGKQIESSADVGLNWQRSRNQSFHFSASASYLDHFNDSGSLPPGLGSFTSHGFAGGLQGVFSQRISERTTLGAYADFQHVFTDLPCSTYGGGVSLGVVAKRGTTIEVGAGPQGASSGCGNPQYTFHGQVSSPLTSNVQVFVRAARQLSVVFGPDNLWEDTVGGGIVRYFRRSSVGADGGFAHAGNGVGSPGSNGYYFSTYYKRELSRSLQTGVIFRQGQFVSGTPGTANFIMAFFGWRPKPLALGAN
jgi:hypothetical protein